MLQLIEYAYAALLTPDKTYKEHLTFRFPFCGLLKVKPKYKTPLCYYYNINARLNQ